MQKPRVNVLLVDDDAIHQYLIIKVLELAGGVRQIAVYSQATEALSFFESNKYDCDSLPDIMLVDINMPVMNGWEFLNEYQLLKACFSKNIRVFVLTSSLDERDIKQYRSYNFVEGYIVKPLEVERIKSIVTETQKFKI